MAKINRGTTEVTEAQQRASWSRQISNMTDDQIGMNDLLAGMSEPTKETLLFRELLLNEYTNRKQLV